MLTDQNLSVQARNKELPAVAQKSSGENSTVQLQDNRPQSVIQKKQADALANIQASELPLQKKGNNTGLPHTLKSGIENLSGHSMDDVKVHYNSSKPAQLNAHAYAQGSEIHLASGQEKHLPHEAWHVVQQKQGRVKPTMQLKGKVNVNDDKGLEKEADVMGAKAIHAGNVQRKINRSSSARSLTIQRNAVKGALGGLAAGAAVGALVGSFVPVIGTAAGAIVGGIVGLVAGGLLGSYLRNRRNQEHAYQPVAQVPEIVVHRPVVHRPDYRPGHVPDGAMHALRGEVAREQHSSTTYGHEAEYNVVLKQSAKGDRLVIIGKIKGRELAPILTGYFGAAVVARMGLDAERTYAGDIMTFSVEQREAGNLARHQALWGGDAHAGVISKSVQMKYGETDDPARTLHNVTYAAIQLAGLRAEHPIPGSTKVIDLGVLNPAHPWTQLTDQDYGNITANLSHAIRHDPTNAIQDPGARVYGHVERIKVRTTNWTFRYNVNGANVTPASATAAPGQHATLLASPRAAAAHVALRTGRLIITPRETFIQMPKETAGQKKFGVADRALIAGIATGTNVNFTTDAAGAVNHVVAA